jgi:hypothetical protein
MRSSPGHQAFAQKTREICLGISEILFSIQSVQRNPVFGADFKVPSLSPEKEANSMVYIVSFWEMFETAQRSISVE